MLMMVVEASVEPSSPYPPSQLTAESFFVDQRFTCYDQIITNGSTSVAHSSLEQGVKIKIKPNYTHKNFYIQTFQSGQVVFCKTAKHIFTKFLKLPSSKLGLYYFIFYIEGRLTNPITNTMSKGC